jgi:hypothetical protein
MGDRLFPGTLDILASTPATLRALLGALPGDITSAPGEEGWSPHDVVAHLTSLTGLTLVGRVRAIIEQDHPSLADVDEHAALEASGLRTRPLGDVLDTFARERAEAVAWVRDLAPDMLARTARHSTAGDLTAAEIIHHKAWHDLLHIEQVCLLLARPLDERRGAMQRFR